MTLVAAGPLFVINGPLPVRRKYDLLSVAQMVEGDGTRHWEAGVQVYTYPTDLPDSADGCSQGSYGQKAEGESPPIPRFLGFTAYLPITCTARGMGPWEQFKNRAYTSLRAKESYAVERQLALDEAGLGNSHLTEGGIAPLSAAAVKPSIALALLENAIAGDTAIQGVIHADPATVTAWSKEFLVYKEGDHLVTVNDTQVVAGAGYIGIHPSDKSAAGTNQSWAFATGPVQVMRSEIIPLADELKQTMERSQNDVTFRAERNYVVDWDTAFLAEVLVDRSL